MNYGNKIEKEKPFNCSHCGIPVDIHPKCIKCEILIHKDKYFCECGVPHTLTKDGKRCIDCSGGKVKLQKK